MILVLAGTRDGRDIVSALVKSGYDVMACSATEYGAKLLADSGARKISGQPLDSHSLKQTIEDNAVKILVDATHPYAGAISAIGTEVSQDKGIRYIRYQRAPAAVSEHPLLFRVRDYHEAARKAADLGEVIFLATGSKTMEIFIEEANKKGRRVVIRLLPDPATLTKCLSLGLTPADIVAVQGPFSYELNVAFLRHFNASVLVTKDGGVLGGTEEKISAALNHNINVVLIERPKKSCEAVGSIAELLEDIKRM